VTTVCLQSSIYVSHAYLLLYLCMLYITCIEFTVSVAAPWCSVCVSSVLSMYVQKSCLSKMIIFISTYVVLEYSIPPTTLYILVTSIRLYIQSSFYASHGYLLVLTLVLMYVVRYLHSIHCQCHCLLSNRCWCASAQCCLRAVACKGLCYVQNSRLVRVKKG